jgi:hypothetical protein
MSSEEDNAKFHSAFSATSHSYATCFQRKREKNEALKYLGEFVKDF